MVLENVNMVYILSINLYFERRIGKEGKEREYLRILIIAYIWKIWIEKRD